MEKQRKKALIVKSTHERAMRQLERKKRITLNYLISEEQKEAAFVKLSTAAARYDKSDATAVPLDAFHVSSLSASEFREQLKRVFNIQATPSDLAAFLLLNNDDMPPAQDRVDCPKFLAHFLKLGITERDKMKQRLLSKARKIEEDRRKEEADRLAVATISKGYWLQESLETSGTLEESRAKALEKLSLSLQSYNIASLGAELLNAFRKAEFMDAASFKSELRQRFKLQLKTAEWTALCAYFLTKEANSDRIHCNEDISFKVQGSLHYNGSLYTIGAAFLQHIKSMLRSSATSPAREVRLLEAPVDDRLKYEAGIDFEYSSDDFNSVDFHTSSFDCHRC